MIYGIYTKAKSCHVVGRKVGSHICFPSDKSVSREHAIFISESGSLLLRDEKSTYGTRVGECKLTGGENFKLSDGINF
jgi:pSer/pThr/pTyr-binding forkhead associated (FHA) protein